jgi:hypothetical protein
MSHHKTGTSRHQVSFGSLDDLAPCPLKGVGPENPVRIIDAFVVHLSKKMDSFSVSLS